MQLVLPSLSVVNCVEQGLRPIGVLMKALTFEPAASCLMVRYVEVVVVVVDVSVVRVVKVITYAPVDDDDNDDDLIVVVNVVNVFVDVIIRDADTNEVVDRVVAAVVGDKSDNKDDGDDDVANVVVEDKEAFCVLLTNADSLVVMVVVAVQVG